MRSRTIRNLCILLVLCLGVGGVWTFYIDIRFHQANPSFVIVHNKSSDALLGAKVGIQTDTQTSYALIPRLDPEKSFTVPVGTECGVFLVLQRTDRTIETKERYLSATAERLELTVRNDVIEAGLARLHRIDGWSPPYELTPTYLPKE